MDVMCCDEKNVFGPPTEQWMEFLANRLPLCSRTVSSADQNAAGAGVAPNRFALSASLSVELRYEFESPCKDRFVTGSVAGMAVLGADLGIDTAFFSL